MDGATGSIYSGDPGVDRPTSHLISHLVPSYHTTNSTHYLSHLLISLVLSGSHRSTQLRDSLRPGGIISYHPLPMLFEPEPLFLTNSLSMCREVRPSVDDGLSAFSLHHFTTLVATWSEVRGLGVELVSKW